MGGFFLLSHRSFPTWRNNDARTSQDVLLMDKNVWLASGVEAAASLGVVVGLGVIQRTDIPFFPVGFPDLYSFFMLALPDFISSCF